MSDPIPPPISVRTKIPWRQCRLRTSFLLLICAPLLVALFISCILIFLDLIPPRENTIGAMYETCARIQLYMMKHGKVPTSAADLPIRKGYVNQTTDGWGYQLRWSVDDSGVVTITSFGADGKQGTAGNKNFINSDDVLSWQ